MRRNTLRKFLFVGLAALVIFACNAVGNGERTTDLVATEEPGEAIPIAISTNTPVPAPLISREPYEWMPPYDDFTTFGSLPFDDYFETSNQDVASSRDDPAKMLAFLNEVGRIHSYGYDWGTDNCWLNNEVFALTLGSVSVVWFKTTEGAQQAYAFYHQEDRSDPEVSVENVEYGEGAYILSGTYGDDCSDAVRYRELMWVRYNMLGVVRMGSHGKLNDEELYKYIVEVRDALDQAMMEEVRAFPNATIQDTPAPQVDLNDPRSFLNGELICMHAGNSYQVSGSLFNNGTRPIKLDMVATVYEDGGFLNQSNETITLPAGEETSISFYAGYTPDPYANVPPDNPDTLEYEPEEWIEGMGGLPEYSCEIKSTAEWGD